LAAGGKTRQDGTINDKRI
jgi:hypothetical protein